MGGLGIQTSLRKEAQPPQCAESAHSATTVLIRMLILAISLAAQPRLVETRLALVQESAFCLRIPVKNYTG